MLPLIALVTGHKTDMRGGIAAQIRRALRSAALFLIKNHEENGYVDNLKNKNVGYQITVKKRTQNIDGIERFVFEATVAIKKYVHALGKLLMHIRKVHFTLTPVR